MTMISTSLCRKPRSCTICSRKLQPSCHRKRRLEITALQQMREAPAPLAKWVQVRSSCGSQATSNTQHQTSLHVAQTTVSWAQVYHCTNNQKKNIRQFPDPQGLNQDSKAQLQELRFLHALMQAPNTTTSACSLAIFNSSSKRRESGQGERPQIPQLGRRSVKLITSISEQEQIETIYWTCWGKNDHTNW